jgi:hypothetical protein
LRIKAIHELFFFISPSSDPAPALSFRLCVVYERAGGSALFPGSVLISLPEPESLS